MELYTVKLTTLAQKQLEEITQYVAFTLQAPETALRLLDLLEQEIASLSSFPSRIALTEEEPWHSLGIHKMTVKNYLVYFWINEARRTVQITAVIHGRRDQMQQLSEMKWDEEDSRNH